MVGPQEQLILQHQEKHHLLMIGQILQELPIQKIGPILLQELILLW